MKSSEIVKALAALAQESRLAIYRLLVERGPTGVSAGEIGAELKVVPATLSFHLKELSHAGLITSRQEGRYIYYSANFDEMNALVGYLTDNCCARDGVTCGPRATCAAEAASAKKSNLKSQRKGAKT
jgi:ArsR family transcriptional regulator, arsenate/arsenite/antimonite-responsive transcriptional repressor